MLEDCDADLAKATLAHLRNLDNMTTPMMDRANVQVDMALLYLRASFFGDRKLLIEKVKFHVSAWKRNHQKALLLSHVSSLEMHVILQRFGFVFSVQPRKFLKGGIPSSAPVRRLKLISVYV